MKSMKLTTWILMAAIVATPHAYAESTGRATLGLWERVGDNWTAFWGHKRLDRDLRAKGIETDTETLKAAAVPAGEQLRKVYTTKNIIKEIGAVVYDAQHIGSKTKYVGNEDKIRQAANEIQKYDKPNLLITGEAGVGKTTFVRGLADHLFVNWRTIPGMGPPKVIQIDINDLLAGSSYRGDLEDKIKWFRKYLEEEADKWVEDELGNKVKQTVIVYFDEVHQIMNAGATADGSTGLAQMLKPLLTDQREDRVRFLSSTTTAEAQVFERDDAWKRRWGKLEIPSPSIDDAISMVQGNLHKYEAFYGVRFPQQVVAYLTAMAQKYIPRALPDPAFDLLNAAGVIAKMDLVESRRVIELRAQLGPIETRIKRLEGMESTIDKPMGRAQLSELEGLQQQRMALEKQITEADKNWRAGRSELIEKNETVRGEQQKLWNLQKELAVSLPKTKDDDLAGIKHNHDLNEAITVAKEKLARAVDERDKAFAQARQEAASASGTSAHDYLPEVTMDQAIDAVVSVTGFRRENVARDMQQTLHMINHEFPQAVPGQRQVMARIGEAMEPGLLGVNVGEKPKTVITLVDSANQRADVAQAIDELAYGARNADEVREARFKTWIIDCKDSKYANVNWDDFRKRLVARPFRVIAFMNADICSEPMQYMMEQLARTGRADMSYLGEGRPLLVSDASLIFHFSDLHPEYQEQARTALANMNAGTVDEQRQAFLQVYGVNHQDVQQTFARRIADQTDIFAHLGVIQPEEMVGALQIKMKAWNDQLAKAQVARELPLSAPIKIQRLARPTAEALASRAEGLDGLDKVIKGQLMKMLLYHIKIGTIKGGEEITFLWNHQTSQFMLYSDRIRIQ